VPKHEANLFSLSERGRSQRLAKTMLNHSYDPLKSPTSIRILELLPGEEQDRIQCRLYNTTLERALQYDALSYAWGSSNNKRIIECNGGRVDIPMNLRDFLKQLRSSHKVRRLWADAICINQSDKNETGHQVRQMASIYSAAERVIIWLGSDDPFDFLVQDEQPLTRIQRNSEQLDKSSDAEMSCLSSAASDASLEEETDRLWTAFARVFTQPWFHRLWVLQEAGLAKSALAMFGEREFDFDDLIRTAAKLNNEHPDLCQRYAIRNPLDIFSTFPKRRPKDFSGRMGDVQDFLDLLEATKAMLASDPRDFIFALLGHPSALVDGVVIIEPDYGKSHQKIHQELAFTLLHHSQDLRVLSAVCHRDQHDLIDEYPSWIPIWTRKANILTMGVFNNLSGFAEADAGFPRDLRFLEANNVLKVHGIAFDVIKESTKEFEGDRDKRVSVNHTYFKTWPLAAAIALNASSELSVREQLLDLVAALVGWGLTIDYPEQGLKDFAALRLEISNKAIRQTCAGPDDLLPEGLAAAKEAARGGSARRFKDESETFILGKRMFVTESGLIGCGPNVLRSGDICCILFGGRIPFLLRPVGSAYRLIGEAFISRAMYGEAMVDWLLGDKIHDELFTIF
jgi:hypothetical protein